MRKVVLLDNMFDMVDVAEEAPTRPHKAGTEAYVVSESDEGAWLTDDPEGTVEPDTYDNVGWHMFFRKGWYE